MLAKKIKIGFILLIDFISFALALGLMIVLRYGLENLPSQLQAHLAPFTILFILWVIVFYLFNLYADKSFRNKIELARVFFLAILVSFVASIVAFYVAGGVFGLTPKTNLIIFTLIFAGLNLFLRFSLYRIFVLKQFLIKIVIIGDGESITETVGAIEKYPDLGFRLVKWIKAGTDNALLETIKNEKVEMVIIGKIAQQDKSTMKLAYDLIPLGVDILDFAKFYESIYRKTPLDELSEEWFIKKIRSRQNAYDFIKRAFDLAFSVTFSVLLLPVAILIAILIKATSAGSAIYKQTRVGKNGQEFTLYKFRTMKTDAEKDGAKWAQKNDERATALGKILRGSHLDEMPQLLNIMAGNLSFVGPRPERPEFTKTLGAEIPHYEIRHTIKPGLTGWAQINYRYGSDIKDAVEKLKYELYYHQNRSIVFDILILLKTIRMIFQNH